VPAYFVSDVHLRLDQPERSRRFARWVEGLGHEDQVVIGGDLCDFWFASRQRGQDPMGCEGLKALALFTKRGGSVTIMPGNHDIWLGPFYEQTLGAQFVQEPLEVEAYGLRIHLVHGHLLGARSVWKSGMESRFFLSAFRGIPGPLAHWLETRLDQSNDRHREAADKRHLCVYRQYADSLRDRVDIAVFGHIHRAHDDQGGRPRMVVLGGWRDGSSYLRIDDKGAALIIEHLPACAPA
jgi:UDP-2,3-diacylglucosamine hydrolase